MRVLFALCLLFSALRAAPSGHPFIVFTNDGTFYKLDPDKKEVAWHSALPFRLLQIDISARREENDTKTQKFFIPTLDGDFLYLEHSLVSSPTREILVPREDVESLLDVCFSPSQPQEEKYFVYEKNEYLVLNTIDGGATNIQEFFVQGRTLDRRAHAILVVSRKLLKQFSPAMEVKWSVISSKISLMDADQFVSLSTAPVQPGVTHELFQFVRVGGKVIEIYTPANEMVFEIRASSPILSIFAQRPNGRYEKIAIKKGQTKLLALEAKPKNGPAQDEERGVLAEQLSGIGSKSFSQKHETFEDFPDSAPDESGPARPNSPELSRYEMCIKTQQTVKKLGSGQKSFNPFAENPSIEEIQEEKRFPDLRDYYEFITTLDPQSAEYRRHREAYYKTLYEQHQQELPTLPFSMDQRTFGVVVAKEQPFVYIFLGLIAAALGVGYYKLKFSKIFEKIAQMELSNYEQNKQMREKLSEFENVGKELKKMYEINWEKLLRVCHASNYMVFEGRFLNQPAEVSVVPLSGSDIIDIEHKLNLLINCSHRNISKLYYYTRNEDSLLIFAEKCASLQGDDKKAKGETKQPKTEEKWGEFRCMSDLSEEDFDSIRTNQEKYPEFIKILLDCVSYLEQSAVDLHSFVESSVFFYQETITTETIVEEVKREQRAFQRDGEEAESSKVEIMAKKVEKKVSKKFTQIRVNLIPSFLEKYDREYEAALFKLGTTKLRLNLVTTIHKIGHRGQRFDIEVFEKEKNTKEEDNFFLKDFYDHLLTNQVGLVAAQPRKNSEQLGQSTEADKQVDTAPNKENSVPVPSATEKQESQDGKIQMNSGVLMSSVVMNRDAASLQGLSSHPYLWDSKQKMLFICDFSNYLETCIDEPRIQKMEAHCKKLFIINFPWVRSLHPAMAKEVNNFRKYDYNSVKDLIRLLRNKLSHFHEIPKETRVAVGRTPEQFVEHLLTRFPKLLSFMYVYAARKKWKLTVQ